MVKFCNFCGLEIHIPDTFTCAYCNNPFCIEHRLVEDHNCKPASKLKQEKYSKEKAKSEISLDWMYESLSIAKGIINKHHNDESDFFSKSIFTLFIQRDLKYCYSFIQGNRPNFRIGIHPSILELTPENRRMLNIILVHELLHCIHADWTHDKIRPEERRIANLAGYFDSFRNMEVLYLRGKMRLCDK